MHTLTLRRRFPIHSSTASHTAQLADMRFCSDLQSSSALSSTSSRSHASGARSNRTKCCRVSVSCVVWGCVLEALTQAGPAMVQISGLKKGCACMHRVHACGAVSNGAATLREPTDPHACTKQAEWADMRQEGRPTAPSAVHVRSWRRLFPTQCMPATCMATKNHTWQHWPLACVAGPLLQVQIKELARCGYTSLQPSATVCTGELACLHGSKPQVGAAGLQRSDVEPVVRGAQWLCAALPCVLS
jgi:hypothetical protein